MRIINRSCLSTDFIQNAIRFVAPKETVYFLDKITVKTLKTIKLDGYFYPDKKEIKIIIGEESDFPDYRCSEEFLNLGYYIQQLFQTNKEAFIFCLSHEFRHVWQYFISKKDWFADAQRIYLNQWVNWTTKRAEYDADCYALIKLKCYQNEMDMFKRSN